MATTSHRKISAADDYENTGQPPTTAASVHHSIKDDDYTSSTESLIKNHNTGISHHQKGHDSSEFTPKGSIELLPFILLNIYSLFVSAAYRIFSPLIEQYIYQRYSTALLGNASEQTSSQPCVNQTSGNSTADQLTQAIQDMSSELMLNLSLISACLGIMGCLLIGAISTLVSRNFLLALPTFCCMVKNALLPVIVFWNLDLKFLYVGYAVEGLGGNIAGCFIVTHLYLSDLTPRDHRRTVWLSFLEGAKGVVSGILYYATGQLIVSTGYLIPSLMSAGFMAISLILSFCLPDRRPSLTHGREGWSMRTYLKNVTSPFHKTLERRVKQMVGLALFSFFVYIGALVGISKVKSLYLMNNPFCWDAVKIGWFQTGQEIAYSLFVILAVPLLIGRLPGMVLGVLGTLSAVGSSVMFALASNDAEIYSIILLSIGQTLPVGIIRGETSRLIGAEPQGSLFALMGVCESISFAVGAPALSLYRASLGVYRGLTYLVIAGFFVVVTVTLSIYHVIWRAHTNAVTSKEMVVKTYGSVN
ncbi:lysosomal proton-coupled steroid conjugate and bile acid symporter SLC46A3-like [Physella acuta]|uniref:lysosomal proton-coupled steroid conjugate and bile acid symporter SLC46A3-like n=1 Tax=Physella acuta TaxID=109671 RepID=UPI0027DACC72|nr:lysosomal proton-coupled steroid conjugate and bile acid symporter SLC46A3-like [Physella acuta]